MDAEETKKAKEITTNEVEELKIKLAKIEKERDEANELVNNFSKKQTDTKQTLKQMIQGLFGKGE